MITADAKLAVAYVRVSSVKQTVVGGGLESQLTRCRGFAEQKGYQFVAHFEDDVSGSLIDRPGMKKMLQFVRKNRAHGVVVIIDDISRLARGLEAHIALRKKILEAGGTLESPSIEFGEDPDSLMVERLLATMSEHHRLKNATQTKNRMGARVLNGYWPFAAPIGYKFKSVSGRGKMLELQEPYASIIQQALESFASGHLASQADVQRFLEESRVFPTNGRGKVTHSRVGYILKNPLYAGYVEAPNWDISLRPGHHEPLISFETHRKILARIDGDSYAPRQTDLSEDFPLRSAVVCGDCGKPLTACWSRGKTRRYGYYHCFRPGCDSYGKSIPAEKLHTEFDQLLRKLVPSEALFSAASLMFKDIWEHRLSQGAAHKAALGAELIKIERQVSQLLDRIVETDVASVISAYEARIRKLESDKLAIAEKLATSGRPAHTFDDALRNSLMFLASPWKLWESGQLESRRAVLKLAFSGSLAYKKNEGFRTPNLALPFKVLGQILSGEKGMARPKRFELLTPRFVVWCSIQLSYGRAGRR
jgi:site-specific DNA recombinase